jgi:hypothetical protein
MVGSFVGDLESGRLVSPSPRALARSRGLAEGSARLVIILPQAFSLKNGGVEPYHVLPRWAKHGAQRAANRIVRVGPQFLFTGMT